MANELLVEQSTSLLNPGLQVCEEAGKLVLNCGEGNYSFGSLHDVWNETFYKLKFRKRQFTNVLVLGLGAGSAVHLLRNRYRQEAQITAIEFDNEVIRLGMKYFGLANYTNLNVVQADAATFVQGCTYKFDLILVDLFTGLEVPEEFQQEGFLRQACTLLATHGLLIFNKVVLSEIHKKQFNSILSTLSRHGTTRTLTYMGTNRLAILTLK